MLEYHLAVLVLANQVSVFHPCQNYGCQLAWIDKDSAKQGTKAFVLDKMEVRVCVKVRWQPSDMLSLP